MAPTVCDCVERRTAFRDGWFLYAPDRDGWIFTDGPVRTMSTLAAYYASERGVENHTGEPYIWTCCPFCGIDLPDERFDIVWRDDATGERE